MEFMRNGTLFFRTYVKQAVFINNEKYSALQRDTKSYNDIFNIIQYRNRKASNLRFGRH